MLRNCNRVNPRGNGELRRSVSDKVAVNSDLTSRRVRGDLKLSACRIILRCCEMMQ